MALTANKMWLKCGDETLGIFRRLRSPLQDHMDDVEPHCDSSCSL